MPYRNQLEGLGLQNSGPRYELGRVTVNPVPEWVLGPVEITETQPAKYTLGNVTINQSPKYALGQVTSQPVEQNKTLQDKLYARILTDENMPASLDNILPGYALRPEVQKVFGNKALGISLANMSPEEQRGLRFILDPQWIKEQGGGV
jgi:hypothetical protein